MKTWKIKAIEAVLLLGVAIALVLGIWWIFWSIWTWALPQLWPTGPEAVIRPSYWLFAALIVLAALFRGAK